MSKFAVIETGGKQYKVTPGQKIKIEKLEADPATAGGAKVLFDKILLAADGDSVKIGTPYVEKAFIEANFLRQGKADKKIVFKYHSKTRYRKKKGHRQLFTEVEITDIK